MSDVLEKVDENLKVTNNGDHDKFQHYFRREAISKNLLEGTPMTALCGKTVKSQVDPKGLTVCPECQRWMDEIVGSNLPNRGE